MTRTYETVAPNDYLYEVLCVIGYVDGVQQIARLEHEGRSTWRTRAIAERHAREYTAAHGRDAYVSEC